MAHETESTGALVAELARDPAWDGAERCALIAEWMHDVPELLARTNAPGCDAHAVASGS